MDYSNSQCTNRYFLSLFEKLASKKECFFMGGAPGAGWGLWEWYVRAETIWFSPSVAEGIFHLAVRRALDCMQNKPYETTIISFVKAEFDDSKTFFKFVVGFLY